MSQPPYNNPYGNPYGQPPQQPDPTLRAPVDPFAPQQPSYDQPAYPGSPAYPSYNDPVGYPDPVSGYPGAQQPYSGPGYGAPEYQQPPQQQPYYAPPQQQPYGQPGYPSYGQPASGGGGKGVVIVLVVILLLVLVGGGIAAFALLGNNNKPNTGPSVALPPGASASAGTSVAPPSPAAPATHSGSLASYLIPPPSGSRNWTSDCVNGNLSIDDASKLSDNASARKDMLNQYGFKGGARQCWVGADRSVVDVRLYQFDSVDHAQSFYKDDIDATSSDYKPENTTTVPGVPDSQNYVDPKKDAQGYVAALAIGLKGDVVFVVSLSEHADVLDTTLPYRLMSQQYQKL